MDVDSIKQLGRKLTGFLDHFADCGSEDVRAHFRTYVEGQVSLIDRKYVEQLALHSGVVAQTLQDFGACYVWDHHRMRTVCTGRCQRSCAGLLDRHH